MDSDSDLIVVDDQPVNEVSTTDFYSQNNPPPPPPPPQQPSVVASSSKSTKPPRPGQSTDPTDRATRSSMSKSKPQPKLKFKLSEKAAAQAPGMSFLGPYDRELDSDDEDLAFEEQFILRMPPGEDCERLRKMVVAREISNDVWFKFKDSRRAIFHIGNSTYSSKLVDLPCIVESQKTLDNKQMFKVADICQMLVVENRLDGEENLVTRNFNFEEFIWPHGITPPLHHVRKRRFRKRVNKRTIESVEQEVERLLEQDAAAAQVKYEILENVNPDLSDSEFIERDALDAPTPAMGSDVGDAPTPGGDGGDGDDDEGDDDEGEGDIDEELAAELDLALGDEEEEADEDDEEDDDDESEEEDEDDDDEVVQARKILNEEIRDLEAAVAKKNKEIATSANPLIRKRFEDALKKLTADLEMKTAQRDEMKEKQWMRKEGINADEQDQDDGAGNLGPDGEEDGSGDLFGTDGPSNMAMEIG